LTVGNFFALIKLNIHQLQSEISPAQVILHKPFCSSMIRQHSPLLMKNH